MQPLPQLLDLLLLTLLDIMLAPGNSLPQLTVQRNPDKLSFHLLFTHIPIPVDRRRFCHLERPQTLIQLVPVILRSVVVVLLAPVIVTSSNVLPRLLLL